MSSLLRINLINLLYSFKYTSFIILFIYILEGKELKKKKKKKKKKEYVNKIFF